MSLAELDLRSAMMNVFALVLTAVIRPPTTPRRAILGGAAGALFASVPKAVPAAVPTALPAGQ